MPDELVRLQRLYRHLVERLDAERVADELYARGKIGQRQHDAVKVWRAEPHRAAEELLPIVMTRWADVGPSFMDALKTTNQDDIYLQLSGIGKLN